LATVLTTRVVEGTALNCKHAPLTNKEIDDNFVTLLRAIQAVESGTTSDTINQIVTFMDVPLKYNFTETLIDPSDADSVGWDLTSDPGFAILSIPKPEGAVTVEGVFQKRTRDIQSGNEEPTEDLEYAQLVFVDVEEYADHVIIRSLAPFGGYIYFGR